MTILAVLTIAGLGQVKVDPATQVPAWVEPLKQKMKVEGLLVGYPDGLMGHPRAATRYEYAVATHATVMHLKNIIQDCEKLGITAEDQKVVAEWSRWAPACLLNLADEFKLELKSMGVVVPELIKEITALKNRMAKFDAGESFFKDVPPGHWAAGAVTGMGRKGLLKGYPGKKFKGQ
ncbi:MAG: S-layer homology domain-containing protein [Fimbriimonadaceae bacterium]